MITRFESTPDHLIVESRRAADWGLLARMSAAMVILVLTLLSGLVGLNWLVSHQLVLPSSGILATLLIAAGAGFPLVVGPWLFGARERVVFRDRELTLERFMGPYRTRHNRYEFLKMRGLHSIGLELDSSNESIIGTVGAGPGDAGLLPGLWFWYRRSAFTFGDTLTPEEQARLLDELLARNASVRSALGMDPTLGLADTGVWASPEVRRAIFEEMAFNQMHYVNHGRGCVEQADRADNTPRVR